MDNIFDELMDVLAVSIEKHGELPLTNKWLFNILKMAERRAEAINPVNEGLSGGALDNQWGG